MRCIGRLKPHRESLQGQIRSRNDIRSTGRGSGQKLQISPSESQRGAGLFGQAPVPPAVAHRQKAAIFRCADLQAVVLSEPHWGERTPTPPSSTTPSQLAMQNPANTCALREYSLQTASSEPRVQSFTPSHWMALEHVSFMRTGGFS